jgi:ER membrane protein complex subunit 10
VKGAVAEEITLYVTADDVPYHISYVLKPSTSSEPVVKVVSDRTIPEGPTPKLNVPVVVNPDGAPPVEEVEKTFLQKYWVYLLPIAILLFTSGGGGGGEGGGE